MPPINQSVTWVYTDDLDATCQFYAGKLGLTQVLDQGQCRIYRMSPTGFLGVCRVRPGRDKEPRGVVITFVTDDVDGWHAHLLANGVTPEGPPKHSEGHAHRAPRRALRPRGLLCRRLGRCPRRGAG